MKIKLKLSTEELKLVAEKVNLVNTIDFKKLERHKKASYSIIADIADKVVLKAHKLSRQLAIDDKKHDVSLKWHEAEALEQYLLHFEETDHYLSNLLLKIRNQLNQKLV